MTILHDTWQRTVLRLSADFPVLECSLLVVHPWMAAGHTTSSGQYLSPNNAVKFITDRLSGTGGQWDVVSFLICAPTAEAFLRQLTSFSAVLPFPEIGRLHRMVTTQLAQAISRMQLPAVSSPGIPPVQTLSVTTTRAVQAASKIASATRPSTGGMAALSGNMAAFKARRVAMLESVSQTVDSLLQTQCEAWGFISTGDVQRACVEIQKNIPQPDTVFSLALLFAGTDLSALRACCHEPDYRPRP
ncbi:MAG: hypothetical protein ACRC4K_02060 [Plesiomonas shigelloides]